MAYTVLARKYRSRTFDEVIGQKPIATTLKNAIAAGRIHHGYLFTGTRGVGKTSMARILAKALNCLRADGPTAAPCMECDACRAIGEGQDIDVIEIDAASNTGVDNIRELRSNASFRPARSRFKIYIIDEVHMLSTGAFNALLKTLEEPPEHVKFILATTEIQKVPPTIQSRVQRFNFRNIGPEDIAERIGVILDAEGAKAEDAAVQRIARLANGSMRDALSLLDQVLSVSSEGVTAAVLDEVLPPPQDEQIFRLFTQVAAADAGGALVTLDALLSAGRGLDSFCNDALELVRALMIVQTCGVDSPLADIPAASRAEYAALAREFELSQFVQIIGLLEELRRNVRFSSAGRALADAAVVRLTRLKTWAPIEQLVAELSGRVVAQASRPVVAAEDEKKKFPAPVAAGVVTATESRAGAPSSQRTARVATGFDRARPSFVPTSPPAERPHAAPPPARIAASAAPADAPAVPRGFALHEANRAESPDAADAAAYDPPESESPAEAPRRVREPTSAERAVLLDDALVREVLDVFDGMLANVLVFEAPAQTAATADDDPDAGPDDPQGDA